MMKLLVAVKRVLDYHLKAQVKTDGSDVELANLKMSMNPFDEIALEQAIQLKEQGVASEVVVVSIGPLAAEETLRSALAMGADRAILVEHESALEPLNVAKILQALIHVEQPQIVLMGKQAIDDDCNQCPQMLAALLSWAQGTFISNLKVLEDTVEVTREVDHGLETLSLQLPVVLSADLRLNQPRFINMLNIMQAKQKPLTHTRVEALKVSLSSHTRQTQVQPPKARQSGIKVKDINELMDKLKHQERIWS